MDTLCGILLQLLTLPYRLWKESMENSRVGPSEWDWETLRFWRCIAAIGGAVVLVVAIAWKVLRVIAD